MSSHRGIGEALRTSLRLAAVAAAVMGAGLVALVTLLWWLS